MKSNHTNHPNPMNHVNALRQTLKPHLQWHGARLSFLALFLIALFRVKTVNLAQLSTGFMGSAKTESNYKRLQRFLREFDLDYYALAKLVILQANEVICFSFLVLPVVNIIYFHDSTAERQLQVSRQSESSVRQDIRYLKHHLPEPSQPDDWQLPSHLNHLNPSTSAGGHKCVVNRTLKLSDFFPLSSLIYLPAVCYCSGV